MNAHKRCPEVWLWNIPTQRYVTEAALKADRELLSLLNGFDEVVGSAGTELTWENMETANEAFKRWMKDEQP